MKSVLVKPERADTTDARRLLSDLDRYLFSLYKPEHRHILSEQELLSENIDFFIVRFQGKAVGCGALRAFENYAEIKRMYIAPDFRRKGIAKLLLDTLCDLAKEKGRTTVRLETGIYQREAIAFYERSGFLPCEVFGEYKENGVSLFYKKSLDAIHSGLHNP